MFSMIFLYLVCIGLLWWVYCGYIYYLFLYNLFRRSADNRLQIEHYPKLAVLVPFYNESEWIEEKFNNLVELAYPPDRLSFVFIDGGSTDGSREKIQRLVDGQESPERFVLMRSRVQGRTHQLNEAMQTVQADILVQTDVDSLLEKDCLLWMINEFQKDPKIGVVGAYIQPLKATPLETKYWAYQNLIRWLESNTYSTSIVIGPCYAFRSCLIREFPEDCAADDIYTCFWANAGGWKAKYLFEAKGYELRTPRDIFELLRHKFRKSNGYIIELLRFCYRFPTFNTRWKIIYFTKILQILWIPFLLLFLAMLSLNFALIGLTYLALVGCMMVFMLANLLATSLLLKINLGKIDSKKLKGGMITSFLYTNFILFFSVLSYWFFFQHDKPEKVNWSKEKQV